MFCFAGIITNEGNLAFKNNQKSKEESNEGKQFESPNYIQKITKNK